MIDQPIGRLVALQFRSVAPQSGAHPTVPVLRVYLRAPDGSHHHHDLMNGNWLLDNEALQFLAIWGYRPSDIGGDDGTTRYCLDDQTCVPVGHMPDGEGWGLAQAALEGGQKALKTVEWFGGEDTSSGNKTASPPAGGGSGGGGGGRGTTVGESGDVEAELAGEESDQGITVNVE